MIVGGREAAKVVDRLKAERVAVVLRLNAPEEPKVPTEDEYRKRPLAGAGRAPEAPGPPQGAMEGTGRHGGRPGEGRVSRSRSRPTGLDRLDSFPAQIRALIAAGLTADQALAALTRQAAAHRRPRAAAGHARARQARPPGRLYRPVPGRAGQGQVRARRRAQVRDQAPEPGAGKAGRDRGAVRARAASRARRLAGRTGDLARQSATVENPDASPEVETRDA